MKIIKNGFNVMIITICGCLISMSFVLSDMAAWSLVISSVNCSPFETVKPYALVFIMWTFIELSYMRPCLIHFVCARIISLFAFVSVSLIVLCLLRNHIADRRISTAVIFIILAGAQALQSVIYKSRNRIELFFAPLMIGFVALFALLIFCSFYPPHWKVFYDASGSFYGINRAAL